MPSITPFELPAFCPSKKRRRDDSDHTETQMPLYGSPKSYLRSLPTNSDVRSRTIQHSESTNLLSAINNNERLILPPSARGPSAMLNMPRKVIPLPVNKRFRIASDDDDEHLHHPYNSLPAHHLSQQSHHSHAHPEYSTPPTSPQNSRPARPNPQALLSACHICHRKPTKKSDLDCFADCAGCGQRACFVCIRACPGWPACASEEENLTASFAMQDVDYDSSSYEPEPEPGLKQGKGGGWSGRGHREMVCSRCCVERGPEGDVVCLGCLAGMEGA
ncbi:hypothetical protein F4781DRAFT_387821 [Annulohypoxylon bovei var. microspora]|nr:hypothetical protein F4781DRAFT_387821 [Annulohypoxylon bovei var. microspora]